MKAREVPAGKADDLKRRRTSKFEFREGGRRAEGFLVKVPGGTAAYRNRCPHAGAPLDFGDNEFFTEDGKFLMCRTHGAVFEPASGLCIAGPCAGESLERFEVIKKPDGRLAVRIGPAV